MARRRSEAANQLGDQLGLAAAGLAAQHDQPGSRLDGGAEAGQLDGATHRWGGTVVNPTAAPLERAGGGDGGSPDQAGVVSEDLVLERLERRARFQAELGAQAPACALVGGEGILLVPGPVQRGHQRLPVPLVLRVGFAEHPELRDQGGVIACLEAQLDLESPYVLAQLIESDGFTAGPVLAGELAQGRPAKPRQGVARSGQSCAGIDRCQAAGGVKGVIGQHRIELGGRQHQPVGPSADRLDPIQAGQCSQVVHLSLQVSLGGVGGASGPEIVHQRVEADRLSVREHQTSEQAAPAGPGEPDRLAVHGHAQWAQDLDEQSGRRRAHRFGSGHAKYRTDPRPPVPKRVRRR